MEGVARPSADPKRLEVDAAAIQLLGAAGARRRLRASIGVWVARIILLVGVLGTWQFASVQTHNEVFFSTPTAIWHELSIWIGDGTLQSNLVVTLQEMLLGFVSGGAVAIVVGVGLGLLPWLSRVLDPFIAAIYSIPKIGLAPLFILWFGIGIKMKIILTASIVFFLVFSSTYAGVRQRDEELLDVLRVMGARWHHLVWKIVMPGALSHIYVGLKLAVPYALVGTIFGEVISSNQGIGYLLILSANTFQTAGLFAGLIVLMLIGVALNGVIGITEARFVSNSSRSRRG